MQGRQCTVRETRAVMLMEGRLIGEDPGLHTGGHEKHLIVRGSCWRLPVILVPQVRPRSLNILDWMFAVNPERDEIITPLIGLRKDKVIIGFVP